MFAVFEVYSRYCCLALLMTVSSKACQRIIVQKTQNSNFRNSNEVFEERRQQATERP